MLWASLSDYCKSFSYDLEAPKIVQKIQENQLGNVLGVLLYSELEDASVLVRPED